MGDTSSGDEALKTCNRCGEAKPESAYPLAGRAGRRRGDCQVCRAAYRRETRRPRQRRRNETADERLTRLLWENYRLTRQQFTSLVEAQAGLCAICNNPPASGKRLSVDHCHTTGVVRALLCTYCNLMLGIYENRGHEASRYLATYGQGNPLLKPAAES